MNQTSQTNFQVKSWDEDTLHDLSDGAKITRAAVVQEYSGQIEGLGTVEYLMAHRGDGTASFVGLENIGGKFRGHTGSFVVQHKGTFSAGVASSEWEIVPGSGTADLAGIEGNGSFSAGQGGTATVVLEVSLP